MKAVAEFFSLSEQRLKCLNKTAFRSNGPQRKKKNKSLEMKLNCESNKASSSPDCATTWSWSKLMLRDASRCKSDELCYVHKCRSIDFLRDWGLWKSNLEFKNMLHYASFPHKHESIEMLHSAAELPLIQGYSFSHDCSYI